MQRYSKLDQNYIVLCKRLRVQACEHISVLGQCYDGASAMRGVRSGLKTLMLQQNPRAHYIHCYAHSLQLGVQDSVKQSKLMADVLDLCSEIARLIRKSPKRSAELKSLKEQIHEPAIGIRQLCPTRYAASLQVCFQQPST